MSGTAGAHLITLVTLPFLQRYFYSTADFANFAWFYEFVLLFVTVGALRLETGIVLEKEERNARMLTDLSLKLVLVAGVIGLIVALIGTFISPSFETVLSSPWIIALVPVAIVSLGVIQVLNSWYTRAESFKFLAGTKLYQTSTASATQLGLGLSKWISGGLIIGRNVGTSIVSLVLLRRYFRSKEVAVNGTKEERKTLLKKHKDFVYFTTPSTFLGTFINFIFIDLFIRFYGEDLTGNLATSKQYLGMGLAFISSAFAQVFYSQIAKIEDTTQLKSYYSFWLKRLVLISLGALGIVYLIPNSLVITILGEKWSQLLPVVRVMAIWMCIMFVSSSLSYVYIKLNRQKTLVAFDLAHLILTCCSIAISYYLYHDFWISLYWFTAAKALYYLFAVFATYYFFEHPVARKNP
jgi:O-antigen/teichoic acid export membrane protein